MGKNGPSKMTLYNFLNSTSSIQMVLFIFIVSRFVRDLALFDIEEDKKVWREINIHFLLMKIKGFYFCGFV